MNIRLSVLLEKEGICDIFLKIVITRRFQKSNSSNWKGKQELRIFDTVYYTDTKNPKGKPQFGGYQIDTLVYFCSKAFSFFVTDVNRNWIVQVRSFCINFGFKVHPLN